MNGTKIKNFFTAKETIRSMKKEPKEWKKNLCTCLSDWMLISRIYKGLKQLNIKKNDSTNK